MDVKRPPTLADIERWRQVLVDHPLEACCVPTQCEDNTYFSGEFEVTFDGPPWWLVSCPCPATKPCIHEALVAIEGSRMAREAAQRHLPDNVLVFPPGRTA